MKKRILTKRAVPGMVVADDVYTDSNQLVLEANTVLDDHAITRLEFYSIDSFRIREEDGNLNTEFPENFTEEILQSPEFKQFNKDFDHSVEQLTSALDNFKKNKSIPMNITELADWTQDVLMNRRNGIHLFHMLHCMRSNDDETYAHSMNVAMICNTIGNWLKMPQNEIDDLTLAGLLHDVGKLFLPPELLKKKEALTDAEFDQLHTHAMLGYNALKRQPVNTHIRYAAMQHHERCDGSGYPNHFTGSQIDSFAKIVAIADSYDAMTSPRSYRRALCPFEVVSLFQSEGLRLYDTKYLMTFMEGLIDTFLYSTVRLSGGQIGEIVMINKSDLARPVVKVDDNYINLFYEHDKKIVEILT